MTDNTTINIQRFETRRQVVEAVQLTADADWQAIAEWCGGTPGSSRGERRLNVSGWLGAEDCWVVNRGDGEFEVYAPSFFAGAFQPVPVLEGVTGEIRQALEGTTPGPWTRYRLEEPDSKEWIINETTGLELAYLGDAFDNDEQAEATAALIAAAPDLLARAADRIEQLEQIWLRDLASALDRLAAAQLATAATTCIRCAAVLPEHDDDCTIVLARSILGNPKEGA